MNLNGRLCLRACVTSFETTEDDIDALVALHAVDVSAVRRACSTDAAAGTPPVSKMAESGANNASVPAALSREVVSRIKIMGDMDIAERRRPQDGRAKLTVDGMVVEARISTLPTLHGEKVVIRLLARGDGVLPLSQQSMIVLSSLAYHDYEGVALEDDEKPRLVRDLGDRRSLILRNHGLLTVGRTVAEAFVAMYFLEAACMMQVRALGDTAVLHGVSIVEQWNADGGTFKTNRYQFMRTYVNVDGRCRLRALRHASIHCTVRPGGAA